MICATMTPLSSKQQSAVTWLEDYANAYGDFVPNGDQIFLSAVTRKDIYERRSILKTSFNLMTQQFHLQYLKICGETYFLMYYFANGVVFLVSVILVTKSIQLGGKVQFRVLTRQPKKLMCSIVEDFLCWNDKRISLVSLLPRKIQAIT